MYFSFPSHDAKVDNLIKLMLTSCHFYQKNRRWVSSLAALFTGTCYNRKCVCIAREPLVVCVSVLV